MSLFLKWHYSVDNGVLLKKVYVPFRMYYIQGIGMLIKCKEKKKDKLPLNSQHVFAANKISEYVCSEISKKRCGKPIFSIFFLCISSPFDLL